MEKTEIHCGEEKERNIQNKTKSISIYFFFTAAHHQLFEYEVLKLQVIALQNNTSTVSLSHQ